MLYIGINHYENRISEQQTQINNLSDEISCNSVTISSLQMDKEVLNGANIQLANDLITLSSQTLQSIEPLREYDKQAYMIAYDNIYPMLINPPETIHDYATDDEFDMICRVVEAEISNGNIDQKINVATCIINRYNGSDVSWSDILTEDNQFTTVENGMWNKVEVTESTRLAVEYAWLFENGDVGDATYFKSGSDSWHDSSDKLEEVYEDGKHTYYSSKGDSK